MSDVYNIYNDEVLLFGEKQARWYQIAAVHGVERALENGRRRVLLEMPTGSGKTFTSGLIFSSERIRKAVNVPSDEPLRLLFIAHKHRLLTQAEREYARAVNVEFIPQSVFQRIPRELVERGWHISVIDEAHHESCLSIQYQLETIGDLPIIGMTATPDRADGCLIKFEEIINPISRQQAVDEGYLASTYINSFVDTSGRVKTSLLKDIIDHYAHEMGQTIVFTMTRREAQDVYQHLTKRGYTARIILNQSDSELDNLLDDFSAGHFQFVVNCNKINEGVDVKQCSDVLLGRQYGSYPQLNQVIGRASRPDTPCNVWELVNPLSGRNLDTTVVVGTPERHRLIAKQGGQWVEREFDYVGQTRSEIIPRSEVIQRVN